MYFLSCCSIFKDRSALFFRCLLPSGSGRLSKSARLVYHFLPFLSTPFFRFFQIFLFFGLCPSKLLFFSFFPPLLPSFSSKIHLSPFFAFFSSTFLFLLSPFFLPLFPPLPTPPFQKTDLPHPGRSVVCKNLFSAFFNKRLRPSAPVPGKAPQTAHKKPGLSACRWRIFQFLPWR